MKLSMSVLRGVCQIPAYVAHEKGLFAAQGLEVTLNVEATAWLAPRKLNEGISNFALLPWTRVAADNQDEPRLVAIAGSGYEEAAIVVRKGLDPAAVRKVAVPLRGGMKDLTAMGLIHSLGWDKVELLRQPSGDGAIIAFWGQGADAASMVEPYATMFETLGVGTVLRRTGDLWPGAPGCSLSTTVAFRDREPEVTQRVVNAFVAGVHYVHAHPQESAQIAHRYIGVNADFIARALKVNMPRADAIRNQDAMDKILDLMQRLGYLARPPRGYVDTSFLDRAAAPGAKTG